MAKMKKPAFNANSMRPLLPGFGTSTVFVYAVPEGAGRYALVFSPEGGRQARLASSGRFPSAPRIRSAVNSCDCVG